MRLSRESILSIKDITQEEVTIPEWNGTVLVQSLSGKKRSEIMDACMDKNGKLTTGKLYPALIVAGCVDPEFSKGDAEALNEKNSGALERIGKAVMRLSGIAADDLDTAEKN
jgi:hypothetical protein